jgi:hypothetical protein
MIRVMEKTSFPKLERDQGHWKVMLLVTALLVIILGSGAVGAAIYFLNQVVTFRP